jgi:hypothetical protein
MPLVYVTIFLIEFKNIREFGLLYIRLHFRCMTNVQVINVM